MQLLQIFQIINLKRIYKTEITVVETTIDEIVRQDLIILLQHCKFRRGYHCLLLQHSVLRSQHEHHCWQLLNSFIHLVTFSSKFLCEWSLAREVYDQWQHSHSWPLGWVALLDNVAPFGPNVNLMAFGTLLIPQRKKSFTIFATPNILCIHEAQVQASNQDAAGYH